MDTTKKYKSSRLRELGEISESNRKMLASLEEQMPDVVAQVIKPLFVEGAKSYEVFWRGGKLYVPKEHLSDIYFGLAVLPDGTTTPNEIRYLHQECRVGYERQFHDGQTHLVDSVAHTHRFEKMERAVEYLEKLVAEQEKALRALIKFKADVYDTANLIAHVVMDSQLVTK